MTTEQKTPETNETAEAKLPPRGERKVTLITTDGVTIECSVMPTLMYLKQQFKTIVRRQQIVASKLAGLESQRIDLHKQLTDVIKTKAENSEQVEKALEELYKEIDKLEEQSKKMNYELAGLCLHFPLVAEHAITAENIAWDKCEESEVIKAQTFFLVP